jgi:hypothetical protein
LESAMILQSRILHLSQRPHKELYSLWSWNPRPMAHRNIAVTIELKGYLRTLCFEG